MFTVAITEKGGSQKRLTFTESEVTIGRVPGNDVVLPKGNVSKRHSRIVLKDNRFIVVDLKSTNGTYVNGRKITSPLVVKEGDKIYIGDFILTLEGDAALTSPADAMKQPSVLPENDDAGAHGSLPPPLPSRAPEPMADGEIPAVLRSQSTPPSNPPSGSANTAVNMQAPNIAPPSAAINGVAAPEPPELTNVVAFPAEEPTTNEAIEPQQAMMAVGAPAVRSVPPVLAPSPAQKSLPPNARDDLRSLMTRLGREFDVDNADPAGLYDEKRWQKAERAIQGKLGELTSEGAITRTADKNSLARAALHEAVGLGPLDALLADPSVRHVVVERFDRVRADRGHGLSLETAGFSSPQALVTVARRLIAQGGVERRDVTSCDLALPNGVQLVAVMPNAASEGPVLSLRRRPLEPTTLANLEQSGRISDTHATSLREALRAKKHVWLVGSHDASPADIMGSLLESCPEGERVAVFERAPDVALGTRASVCFKLGVVALSELVEHVRYFKPQRLVLHELRDADLEAAILTLAHRRDGSIVSSEHGSAQALKTAFERGDHAGLAAQALSLVVELSANGEGETRVSAVYELSASAGGELSLKSV
jgi:pilus assembly protein CpaF